MKKKFFQVCTSVKTRVSNASHRAKLMAMGAVVAALAPAGAFAQELAGTGYDAGTSALEEVASELVKYVPYVVNLCYALAGTGYDAGTSALEEVASELVKYIPYVVNLCYALAGIFAVVGAISVYIAMNNEEQDVKNILVLQNRQETRRKEMKLNSLLHNTLCRYFNFPIFENVVLKNI